MFFSTPVYFSPHIRGIFSPSDNNVWHTTLLGEKPHGPGYIHRKHVRANEDSEKGGGKGKRYIDIPSPR